MRYLLGLMLVVALAVGAAWLGGETLLANRAAKLIETDPRLSAATITPLRQMDRIGIQATDLRITTPAGEAELPTAQIWAAPTSPNDFKLSLPAEMTLPLATGPMAVTAQNAGGSLRISPANGMAVGGMQLSSGPVAVAGKPVLDNLSVNATLSTIGVNAPRAARASYDVRLALQGLDSAGLAALGDAPLTAVAQALDGAGPLGAKGDARVYLDRAIPVRAGDVPPQVTGFQTQGITLTLGDQAATIRGWVQGDAQNRAEGAIMVDTADARGFLELAAAAGIIPSGAVALANSALTAAAANAGDLPAGVPAPPPPAGGDLRLTITMRDGRMALGPIPLGPAPLLPHLQGL